MKRACVLVNPRMSHQGSWADAFASGLRRHGWHADISTNYFPADMLAMWGVRRADIISLAKRDGADVCIAERGYMGDRKKYISISFGGELNGRAEFRGPAHDYSRFDSLFGHLLRPWYQPKDGYALIMGQVDGDMSTKGVNLRQWYDYVTERLKADGWQVCFRPHPLNDRRNGISSAYRSAQQAGGDDLRGALDGAALVVTYNSTSGVDAALRGRPVIAFDEGSMAWPVAGHEIGKVVMPDRAEWCARLAWCQYTKAELESGFAWEAVSCRALAA